MTVFDTLNDKVKYNLLQTLQEAKIFGQAMFGCQGIDCPECLFGNKSGGCTLRAASKSRTLEEWADFLFSEIKEES